VFYGSYSHEVDWYEVIHTLHDSAKWNHFCLHGLDYVNWLHHTLHAIFYTFLETAKVAIKVLN